MHASWKSWSATGLALVAVTDKVFAHQDNNRHIRRLEKDYQVLRGRDSTCTSASSTYTITSGVTTTNSAGSTITSISTYTTTQAPVAATKVSAGTLPAYTQTTVSKLAAVETSSSSGGLNQAQLGGVIGGVVAVFVAVIVAAFLVIRRLRKNARLMEESKRGSSVANQTTTSSKRGGVVTTTVTEVGETNDVDPLALDHHFNRPGHLRAESDSSTVGRHQSPARSPALSSGHSMPPPWPGSYKPVHNPDNQAHQSSIYSGSDGYDDAERQFQMSRASESRASYDSQTSNVRSRHYSNVSEVSGSWDGQHGLSELGDATADASRRRSSSGATRPAPTYPRRTSDTHQRGRSDSSAPGLAPLSEINEALHGYYGPSDRQVGQTADRLKAGNSPTTPET
ncbi:hypothetical protein E8E14_006596 [Neopestalotiopsis sp. 37M]|nr:hypothetical protein E8E14_006596 [Neopestalotiopsis sp. 37M]